MGFLVTVMSQLSYGALLKAKRALVQQPNEDESPNGSTSGEESSGDEAQAREGLGGRGSFHEERKEHKPKEKRINKHASVIHTTNYI